MSDIASVVEELVIASLFSEKAAVPRKSMADWALMAMSALLAGAGILFLILSLNRYLEEIYTPKISAFAMAGCLFLMAFIPVLGMRYLRARRVAPVRSARHPLADNLRLLIEAVCVELEEPVKDNPKAAVALAAFAGFLATNNQMRL